jgi:hypothetical protein
MPKDHGNARGSPAESRNAGPRTEVCASGLSGARDRGRDPEKLVDPRLGERHVGLRRRDDEPGHHLDLGEHFGVMNGDVQLIVHGAALSPSLPNACRAPGHRESVLCCLLRSLTESEVNLSTFATFVLAPDLAGPPGTHRCGPDRLSTSRSVAVSDHGRYGRDHHRNDAHGDREGGRKEAHHEPGDDDQTDAGAHEDEVESLSLHP